MQVALLGGAGYLGSVISLELISKGIKVDIYDNLMFCDEFAEVQEVKVQDVFKSKINYVNYDKVIWCMDIDVPEFYAMEESQEYITRNVKKFTEISKVLGPKLLWVTGLGLVEKADNPYSEMLVVKNDITDKFNVNTVIIPELYGTSPRMRFDTLVNKMIITSIIESVIYVEGWMDVVDIQSVAVVGKTIAESIITDKYIEVEVITLTKLEIAYLVKKAMGEKIAVLLSEENHTVDGCRSMLSTYDKDTEFSIEKTIDYMIAGIERGVVDSIVKDMYNNSRIVSNYVSTGKLHTFVDGLVR